MLSRIFLGDGKIEREVEGGISKAWESKVKPDLENFKSQTLKDLENLTERQSKKLSKNLLRTGLILIGVGAATQVGVHYLNRKIDQRMGYGNPVLVGRINTKRSRGAFVRTREMNIRAKTS